MEFIKKNFQFIVIVALIIILFFKSNKNNNNSSNKIDTVKIETITKIIEQKGTTVINKPVLHDVQPYQFDTHDTLYLPDTTYNGLLVQYRKAIDSLLATKTYYTEHKFDTLGSVKLKNVIQNNELKSQLSEWNIKYPVITKTIIIKDPIKRALYIGGGLQGTQLSPITQVSLGLLYKNKKGNLTGIQVGIDKQGTLNYGINSYIKIKLKK